MSITILFLTCEGSNIPCNIVAPANGLNPVNSACIKPDQVPGTLDEPINRHIELVQVLQVGPPGTHQEVDVVPVRDTRTYTAISVDSGEQIRIFKVIISGDVLFTEVVDDTPVCFRHSKPLTVPRTNVDVD